MEREGKNKIVHVIYLNKSISITILDITMKVCMFTLHIIIHFEGCVSQIFFYLGLSLIFM